MRFRKSQKRDCRVSRWRSFLATTMELSARNDKENTKEGIAAPLFGRFVKTHFKMNAMMQKKIGKVLKKSIINCALCVWGKIFVERETNEKREP